MNTERLSSGPPKGSLEFLSPTERRLSSKEKGTESFESQLEATSSERPNGNPEAGPRINKDLSVKAKLKADGEEESEANRLNQIERKIESDLPKANLTPRQKAMQEFMDSIESEFGIPPERIVEAMAQLSDKELIKPAVETASQLIGKLSDNLHLTESQESRLEALYVRLLTKLSTLKDEQSSDRQTTDAQLASQLALMQMGPQRLHLPTERQIPSAPQLPKGEAPLVPSEKDRRVMLNQSLDRMNQKFFMSGTDGDRKLDQMMELKSPLPTQDKTIPLAAYKDQLMAADSAMPLATTGDYKKLAAALGKLDQSIENLQKPEATGQVDIRGLDQVSPEIMTAGLEQNLGETVDQQSQDGASHQQSDSSNKGQQFFVDPKASEKVDSLKNENSSFSLATTTKTQASHQKSEPQGNIQQIMNQAQYMIRKGGGDAIVKLNPEGLGELHLKVSVDQGRVNVHMAAETKEAKALIESSMSDLKSSLNAQQLKVDSVKVDVGNQTSADQGQLNQQNQFRFDQQREQARNFLGNFRDDNSSNRGLYYESSAIKSHNPNKGPAPLTPAEEVQGRARRYIGEGRGSGLNLVA